MKNSIEVIRGDDHSITFTLTDENAAVVDLTGATIFFTVKDSKDIKNDSDDTGAVIAKNVSPSDPANGIAVINLTNTDTNITPKKYIFDLQIKFADDTVKSIEAGNFIVIADVTRETS